jgi:hypothetical protein
MITLEHRYAHEMRTPCAGRQNSGSFRGEHDEEPPTAGAGSATHIHDVDAQGSHPNMSVKEEAAFANCCKAIDMHEAFERLAIRQHGSFLPHRMIFKVTRDILAVGDV